MAKAKSIGAVHTHTHTHHILTERIGGQSGEREPQSSKIGFYCSTQKYIARYIRQKLYVCESLHMHKVAVFFVCI